MTQVTVYTDGGASGNPGPGGYGAVMLASGGKYYKELSGAFRLTTNNRMELQALIEALGLLGEDDKVTVYSDSQLCVKTVNEWAAGWERRGWKRKTGPIKNLDLVQELWALSKARPGAKFQWIKAHDGSRWNEYADALASSYMLR